jgi:hypothetical protein
MSLDLCVENAYDHFPQDVREGYIAVLELNKLVQGFDISCDDRLATFHTWPVGITSPSKESLAMANFKYSGQSDEVYCDSCQLRVNQWLPHMEPMKRHKSLSPSCAFVKLCLPENVPPQGDAFTFVDPNRGGPFTFEEPTQSHGFTFGGKNKREKDPVCAPYSGSMLFGGWTAHKTEPTPMDF